jgi:hypothetical protein
MHDALSRSEAVRGNSAEHSRSQSWYSKRTSVSIETTLRVGRARGLRCLFRDYVCFAGVVDVVMIENTTNVPLRRVFRYAGIDVYGWCSSVLRRSSEPVQYCTTVSRTFQSSLRRNVGLR